MNSTTLRRAAAVASVLLTAACSDAPMAPKAPAAPQGGINFSLIGKLVTSSADTTVTQFTVDPTSSTTFQVGSAHAVYFPAYSICDMSVTSYGPTEWDKPCQPTSEPIVITAKSWVGRDGLPKVDFSPALRFRQASNGDVVQLALAVDPTKVSTPVKDLNILYCASALTPCVDESLNDPTMDTWVSPFSNAVYRRIKHFSVYNVSSGFVEETVGGLGLGLSLSRASGAVEQSNGQESRTGHLMSSGRHGAQIQ